MASRGSRFDPEIATAFLENIAVYPVSTIVELNTGEIGTVVGVLEKLQTRPLIRLLVDANGQLIAYTGVVADLSEELTRYIVKVLKPEEILALGKADAAYHQASSEDRCPLPQIPRFP